MNKFKQKYLSFGDEKVYEKKLTKEQHFIICGAIVITIIFKFFMIPYNMMTMGDSATRVWNALWWANEPFFVVPESGHPFYFYMMGPLIAITNELYYSPIFLMFVVMTISGYFIFRITNLFFGFRAAMLAFFVVILNPALFRFNFEAYAQQPAHMFLIIMMFFLINAMMGKQTFRNFTIAGVMAFFSHGFRPEMLFILAALCIIVFFSEQKGKWNYIILALSFQILWITTSFIVHGEPFRTFNAADSFTDTINIEGINIALRLKGLFLPYYFLVLGLTFIIFYFFVRGVVHSLIRYPKVATITLLVPVFIPAIVNGTMGMKSTLYNTTQYLLPMFWFSSIFTGAGLNNLVSRMRKPVYGTVIAALLILTCIPLSYIKDFAPEALKPVLPRIVQFNATTEEPEETRMLLKFIDDNIDNYPSLIFDVDGNTSSLFYVPYYTRLSPPERIMISSHNIPKYGKELQDEIMKFMNRNRKGIVMHRKNLTAMSAIFSTYFSEKLTKRAETEKWVIHTWE